MVTRIFVAGDLHIPSRASMIHPSFQRILEKEQWDYIALTGDFTIPQVLKRFESYVDHPKKVLACRGNMDNFDLPWEVKFEIGTSSFGIYHGADISPRGDIPQLKLVARDMNVRVLLTGHTHTTFVHEDNEHIILNPGTASGASGGSSWTVDTATMVLSVFPDKHELSLDWFRINRRGKLSSENKRFNL